jgi:hypothetical protein
MKVQRISREFVEEQKNVTDKGGYNAFGNMEMYYSKFIGTQHLQTNGYF